MNKELKDIEKQQAALATKKKQILEAEKAKKQAKSDLEAVIKKSGYKNARALALALDELFGLRLGIKKPGRPSGNRRSRTKVTPELRDAIKKEAAGGVSVNKLSKIHDISYAVVAKIVKGGYDKI